MELPLVGGSLKWKAMERAEKKSGRIGLGEAVEKWKAKNVNEVHGKKIFLKFLYSKFYKKKERKLKKQCH